MKRILFLLLCLGLCGCSTIPYLETQALNDPSIHYESYNSFYLMEISGKKGNKSHPLIEKHLLSSIKNNLISKGYVSTDDITKSDFTVCVQYISKYEESYIPPKNYTAYEDIKVKKGANNNPEYTITFPYEKKTPGENINFYVSRIDISMLNTGESGELIWEGKGVMTPTTSDITEVGDKIITEILKKFPKKQKPKPKSLVQK